MITAVIISYWKPRKKYLHRVLAPHGGKVILWNNDDEALIGAINSPKNYHSWVRYVAALLSPDEYILFQDDDIVLSPEAINSMAAKLSDNPESIVGLFGKNLADDNYPYTHAVNVEGATEEVDVVLGRAFMLKKPTLVRILAECIKHELKQDDDILASLVNKKSGYKNFVVPGEVENLDEEGHGYFYEGAAHYNRRDAMCLKMR